MIKLITAVDLDNAIGWQSGALPWHIKEDLQRFKALTTGHDVVMGRKTFESLNRPAGLPNRRNHVVSRSAKTSHQNPWFYRDFLEFVDAHQERLSGDPTVLWIIGGAEIYRQALEAKIVDEIHLTLVKIHSGADVHFPFDLRNLEAFFQAQADLGVKWTLDNNEEHQQNADKFEFLTLKRI